MAQAKGGRKLKRGTKRRARTAIQTARTLKNKHTRAARRTRRKAYWQSEQGQTRKTDKKYARLKKQWQKPKPKVLPLLDNINAPSPLDDKHVVQPVPFQTVDEIAKSLDVPVLKLDAGSITGDYAGDVFISDWENEGGLSV